MFILNTQAHEKAWFICYVQYEIKIIVIKQNGCIHTFTASIDTVVFGSHWDEIRLT